MSTPIEPPDPINTNRITLTHEQRGDSSYLTLCQETQGKTQTIALTVPGWEDTSTIALTRHISSDRETITLTSHSGSEIQTITIQREPQGLESSHNGSIGSIDQGSIDHQPALSKTAAIALAPVPTKTISTDTVEGGSSEPDPAGEGVVVAGQGDPGPTDLEKHEDQGDIEAIDPEPSIDSEPPIDHAVIDPEPPINHEPSIGWPKAEDKSTTEAVPTQTEWPKAEDESTPEAVPTQTEWPKAEDESTPETIPTEPEETDQGIVEIPATIAAPQLYRPKDVPSEVTAVIDNSPPIEPPSPTNTTEEMDTSDPDDELPNDVEMSLFDHLEELRQRIFYGVIGVVVAVIGCFVIVKPLVKFLEWPAQDAQFVQLAPGEFFFVSLKVAAYSGLVLASPWILYQIIQFVLPGLTRREQRFLGPIVLGSSSLFIIGLGFSYVALIPAALNFFISYGEGVVLATWSIDKYFEFVLLLMFSTALTFQVPIVQVLLGLVGIVNSKQMFAGWRYVLLGAAILGAVITPSTDPLTQTLLGGAVLGLYFGGAGVLSALGR